MLYSKKPEFIEDFPPIYPAYYKKQWVGVPTFFIPERAKTIKPGYLTRSHFEQDRESLAKGAAPIEELPRRNCETGRKKILRSISASIIPWLLSPKKLKEICIRADIPEFWVTGEIPKRPNKGIRKNFRREKKKHPPLKPTDFRKFTKELNGLHKPSVLIAELLWFLNKSMKGGGLFFTLEGILRVRVHDISPEPEHGFYQIRLSRKGFNSSWLVVHYLPEYLANKLLHLIHPDSWYVFANKRGAPFLPMQIDTYFKKAGKKTGIETVVSSLSLRPTFNRKSLKQTAPFIELPPAPHLQEVAPNEWKVICEQVPTIIHRRGCKSKNHPRDILNAVLYHLREHCPLRKLSSEFPPYQAVESQYRRWQKNGVLDAIFQFREERKHKK